MPRLTQSSLARILGVTRQAIHDLVARGVITADDNGKIDEDEARAAIAERVQPRGKTAAAVSHAAPAPAPAPASATPAAQPPAAAPSDATAMNYHVARTLREAAEAQMAQLKLQQQRGNLIDKDAAVQAVYTTFRALRDTLLALPRRHAAALADAPDRHALEQQLDTILRDALTLHARKAMPALAASLGAGAIPAEPAPAAPATGPQP